MSDKNGQQHQSQGLVKATVADGVPATVSFARGVSGGAKESLYLDIVEVLWRRKLVIFLIVLACAIYSYVSISRMTPIYASTTRVYVSQNTPTILPGMVGLTNNDNGNGFLYVQAELLKSTQVLKDALDIGETRKLRTFAGAGNPLACLRSLVMVEISKDDDSLKITCESPYADEAAILVNTVVQAYMNDVVKNKQSTAHNALVSLQKEKDKHDLEMASLLNKLNDFKHQYSQFSFENEKGTNPVLDKLATLSQNLTVADLDTEGARSKWETAEKLKGDPAKLEKLMESDPGSMMLIHSEPVLLESTRKKLQLQLDVDKRRFAANHTHMKQLQDELDQTESQLLEIKRQAAQVYVAVLYQQWKGLERKQTNLRLQFDEQQKMALEYNKLAAEYVRQQADVKQVETTANLIESRMKDIHIAEDVRVPNVSVIEEAQASAFPTRPNKTKLLGIGLAVGLFLGISCAFMLDWLDHRIRSPEDVRSMVQVPILGIVPHVSRKATLQQLGQAVHLQPRSSVAEAYRTVRMAVHFSGIEHPCQKILVTSAVSGDGKTVTVANLALAIAQAGQRVVIVDADFHRPKLHTIFGTPNESGFSNVLQGQVPLEDVVLTTPVPRVDILPCGPLPPNPFELL
ncbi:MAG: Wzz/FepE/Etk N-terminal domain-containing protein, partial [Phycisphaerae bacterium]